MTMCIADQCERPVLVEKRGLCGKHYKRWQKHGDAEVTKLEWDPMVRLDRYVTKQPDGCWIFAGKDANEQGHQRWTVGGKRYLVHRWTYEHFVGPIPEGFVIDHLCRVPACCNPEHLQPVTQRVNVARAASAPPTINAAKTHCKRGHAFEGRNTVLTPTGARQCRTCRNAAARRHQSAKRAAMRG